jgi:hypothetical protein
MVGHGQHDTLVSTAYGKILQDPADECIDWYSSAIEKAWEDRQKPAQLKELRALETLLHCRRQRLIRKAASRGGTLELNNGFEWVCTSSIAEIDKNKVAQGCYHSTETGEKREYGELHLRKLHDDYEIVVENIMAKGERHELPLALKWDAASPTMEIKEAQDGAPDRIEGDIAHARTKDTTGTTVLTELRQDSIIPGITLRNEESDTDYSDEAVDYIDTAEQYIPGTVQTTQQSEGKKKGPKTRLHQRIDMACKSIIPITVSDLDEMDKTPQKLDGRSASKRRSTKRP